jgi:ATP-dependent protease ClpP protease subunit
MKPTNNNKFYVFDQFDEDMALDFVSWVHSKEDLAARTLEVYINSPGGILDSCFSMLNVMSASQHKFKITAMGSISSCGLVFFMAGDHRVIYDNCLSMSHQFSWGSSGKHHELEASSTAFKLTGKYMEDHYVKHSKLTRDEVKKTLLKESDVYLTAREMKKYGLADEVIKT